MRKIKTAAIIYSTFTFFNVFFAPTDFNPIIQIVTLFFVCFARATLGIQRTPNGINRELHTSHTVFYHTFASNQHTTLQAQFAEKNVRPADI